MKNFKKKTRTDVTVCECYLILFNLQTFILLLTDLDFAVNNFDFEKLNHHENVPKL